MKTVIRIAVDDVQARIEQEAGIILDVRTATEFESGHLEGAQNLDFLGGEFAKNIDSLDKAKTYYLYCRSGGRSGKSTALLLEAGFENAYNIGGFEELANAGLPTDY